MGRGDVRPLLIVALIDGPAHGYELIQRLEARSGGAWRPSPGSVYPTLQLLEEAGLVVGRDDDGKRVYDLTAAGRSEAEAALETGAAARWESTDPEQDRRLNLRRALGDLRVAARQVGEVADSEQLQAAVAIVRDARQKLYRLLIEQEEQAKQ